MASFGGWLGIKEARSICNTLRREYPKMFAVSTKKGKSLLIFTMSQTMVGCYVIMESAVLRIRIRDQGSIDFLTPGGWIRDPE